MTDILRRQLCRGAAAAAALFAALGAVQAQEAFPSRPVRIIVNTVPGGLTDVVTRLVAQRMGEILKQQVVVENRPGGDGLIGIRSVKTAPPDGYTLLAAAGTVVNQTVLRTDAGYDVLKDFTGVALAGRSPFLLVVEPNQPYRSVQELVAAMKADPARVTYGSAGVGTVPHLGFELFLQRVGLAERKPMHVPYKGNAAAMPDVMAGRVTTILEAYGSSSGKIKAGQLRAIGVTSGARLAALPDVPTFAEQGVPQYSWYTWTVFLAPAGTPREVVARLAAAAREAVASPAMKERFRDDGLEASDMTPDDINQFLARELTSITRLASELKLPKL